MKVMIVEDSIIVREVLHHLLTEISGLSVIGEFCCAPTAIAGIRRDPPDILLLDIELRAGRGMDVLKMAAAEHPATKVIVVSNHADPVYRRYYQNAGAHGFYDKCRELDGLRAGLENLARAAGAQPLAVHPAGAISSGHRAPLHASRQPAQD